MTACAKRTTGLLLSILLIGGSASADTVAITLDNVEVDTCDTEWTEGIGKLQVVDTVEGDPTPPGSCIWDQQAEGVALLGARLEIDTTQLEGVEEVDVDLRENSGNGHTEVKLYNREGMIIQFVSSSYTGSPTDQTLPIFIPGSELGKIVISGNDVLIQELRLNGNLKVEGEGESWGTLKSRW
jgi:hypothetical protein